VQRHGTVLSCGRYGCVVRLDDGRIANLPSSEPSHGDVRRAATHGRRPHLPFIVSEKDGWLTLRLADEALTEQPEPATPAAEGHAADGSNLDEKIIDYLRQTEDWDPKGAIASRAHEAKQARADRLLPVEMRARKQYRESPKKPPRKKR
jgi:hypothetical protein